MASVDFLRTLDALHAFDPVPLPGYRSALYSRFENLLGGAHEARLGREVVNVQRIALTGTIGSGKSSMIEYALTTGAPRIAPIWVAAAHQSIDVLVDPPEFARNLIRAVVAWAREAGTMSVGERQAALVETSSKLPVRAITEKHGFSLRMALGWLEPAVSREVEQTLADPELERSPDEFVASLDRLVDLVQTQLGLVPVVVIDDTDRWLRFETKDRERLLTGFFSDTCRMLSERNWSVLLAVHPEYATNGGFRTAVTNGYFTVKIDVPILDSPEAVRAIFEHRVRAVSAAAEEQALLEAGIPGDALAPVSVEDVFEPGFDRVLFDHYRASKNNVRTVLTVVQQALLESIGLGEPIVSIAALREATLAVGLPSHGLG
jgi:hypothetical protein